MNYVTKLQSWHDFRSNKHWFAIVLVLNSQFLECLKCRVPRRQKNLTQPFVNDDHVHGPFLCRHHEHRVRAHPDHHHEFLKIERETNITKIRKYWNITKYKNLGYFTSSSTPSWLSAAFRCVVDEESVEGKAVGQDEVADVVTTNAQCVQLYRVAILQRQLHRLQMSVHAHVHT